MRLHRQRDNNKSGIYQIKNLVNNKIYIGRSVNIYNRIRQHINLLNKKSKEENPHLIKSWHKYGREFFEYCVLEYCSKAELYDKELYWINTLKATTKNIGYNLRIDIDNKYIVSEETRKKLSNSSKNRILNYPNLFKEIGLKTSKFWKDNPSIKKEMAKKVSDKLTEYKIYQYNKETNELIQIWEKLIDIIIQNPSYKKHNIYAVCSGEKPSMYGFIWKKVKI